MDATAGAGASGGTAGASSGTGGAIGGAVGGGGGGPVDAKSESDAGGGTLFDVSLPPPPTDVSPSCDGSLYKAVPVPAAILFAIDHSPSMAGGNKWTIVSQAMMQAIDADTFDGDVIGLAAAPSTTPQASMCSAGMAISCESPMSPQVPLATTAALKSTDTSGVRHDIMQWLTANPPDESLADVLPFYDLIGASVNALVSWPGVGARVLFVVTDGGMKCGQESTRPGYADCNGCDRDWEDPSGVIGVLAAAHANAAHPVDSFIVGAPGADSFDSMGCIHPPYHMRLALSAMAYAGAPEMVDPACTGTAFAKDGADPTVSCHFDLTQGAFDAPRLAAAMAEVRKTFACVYSVPARADIHRVNVELQPSNGQTQYLLERSNAADACADGGCWDEDKDGNIELVGTACDDVKADPTTEVQLFLGCPTLVKQP